MTHCALMLTLMFLFSFCSLTAGVLPSPPALLAVATREHLIRLYSDEGYNYSTILSFLSIMHGITLSVRHLKRIVKKLGLRRRVFIYNVSHFQRTAQLIKASDFIIILFINLRGWDFILFVKFHAYLERNTRIWELTWL